MAVVIDDHLLLELIAGIAAPMVRDAVAGEAVYTTGCWYYRLARAVLADRVTGSLSSRLESVGEEARDATLASIRRLPDVAPPIRYQQTGGVQAHLRAETHDALAV